MEYLEEGVTFIAKKGCLFFRSFQQIELVMNFYINLTVPFELDFW